MKRYSREQMLGHSGAKPEELAELEARRLLVPNRRWQLFGEGDQYYTEDQLAVLRWLVKTRRQTAEARARSTAGGTCGRAAITSL